MNEYGLSKGNLVDTGRGIAPIHQFVYNEVRVYLSPTGKQPRRFGFLISELKPVSLTVELLIEYGFKKNGILYEKDKFAIKFWSVGFEIEWIVFWGDKTILYSDELCVHELQNLYFSLTKNKLIS